MKRAKTKGEWAVMAFMKMFVDASNTEGSDKQAFEHVAKRMQDIYGSPEQQAERASNQ